MLFSQSTEYALRAAVWLAETKGRPQTTQQIAEATLVPQAYLSKILQSLARAGLVRGSRGVGGGFELTRPGSQVTILAVVNAVDPIVRIQRCPLQLTSHQAQLCPLHRKLDEAIASIEAAFGSATLADMLGRGTRSQPLCELVEVASR